MQALETINAALAYIETNLKTDITAEELAKMANYSTYHYCRLFSSIVGAPVSGYILRRRLDHALAEISAGRKAIDVVLEYGFDTYAGFYKAFVKMYGCSPKKYLSIYHEHNLKKSEGINMLKKEDLYAILENWNIEKNLPIKDIYIMDDTKISDTEWFIGDKYILKTDDRESLLKEIQIMKLLNQHGGMVLELVPTKTGEDYFNGDQMFTLRKKLKGDPLPQSEQFGEERFHFGMKYGKSLAKLHQALKFVEEQQPFDEENLYQTVLEWALPNVQKQNQQWNMGIPEEFFSEYIEEFGKLYEKLPRQLLHRDPGPNNIMFDHGEVTGFVHFSLSEINVRLWDVCYCATGVLFAAENDMYERWLEVLRGVFYGYDEISRLTPEEKKSIFYVICSIYMICIALFEEMDEFKWIAKKDREMMQIIIAKRKEIESIF